jgi:hypothetical protein
MNARYYETKLNTVAWWASQLGAKTHTVMGATFLWFDDPDSLEAMYLNCLDRGYTVARYGLTLELRRERIAL